MLVRLEFDNSICEGMVTKSNCQINNYTLCSLHVEVDTDFIIEFNEHLIETHRWYNQINGYFVAEASDKEFNEKYKKVYIITMSSNTEYIITKRCFDRLRYLKYEGR